MPKAIVRQICFPKMTRLGGVQFVRFRVPVIYIQKDIQKARLIETINFFIHRKVYIFVGPGKLFHIIAGLNLIVPQLHIAATTLYDD
jgi:hypothetical protein